jgi:hypothetical protein
MSKIAKFGKKTQGILGIQRILWKEVVFYLTHTCKFNGQIWAMYGELDLQVISNLFKI